MFYVKQLFLFVCCFLFFIFYFIARRKKLKRDGFGGRPNATRSLSDDEVNELWEQGYFGTNSGVAVQRGIWWLLSIHCGWRGCDEARQLC